ncbi:fructose-1,6-bisphosphatase [Chloropicon primus]|nr:fructose-1,6-bisphosphatase [Chloropicon primus]
MSEPYNQPWQNFGYPYMYTTGGMMPSSMPPMHEYRGVGVQPIGVDVPPAGAPGSSQGKGSKKGGAKKAGKKPKGKAKKLKKSPEKTALEKKRQAQQKQAERERKQKQKKADQEKKKREREKEKQNKLKMKQQTKAGKKKKEKDPLAPKRARTAFNFFLDQFRGEYKLQHPESKGVVAVTKAGSERWKQMSPQEKQPYEQKAESARDIYQKAKKEYQDQGGGAKFKLMKGPPRPPTAYFMFLNTFRQEYKARHPDVSGIKEMSKEAGERWRAMDQVAKEPYESKAKAAKEFYNKLKDMSPEERVSATEHIPGGKIYDQFNWLIIHRQDRFSASAAQQRRRCHLAMRAMRLCKGGLACEGAGRGRCRASKLGTGRGRSGLATGIFCTEGGNREASRRGHDHGEDYDGYGEQRRRGDGGGGRNRERLVSLSGVEDGRYADVDLESLRKALVSSQSFDEDVDSGPDYSSVQGRNLALELVRVTEAAALEAGRWFGRGSEEKADRAATAGMRKVLNAMEIDGVVVIGQGALDDVEEDPRLALLCGERVGCGYGHEVDVAVKALDGTTLVSEGHQGSLSVICTAERGALLDTGPCEYMEKIVVGADVEPGVVSLDRSLEENLNALSETLSKPVTSLTVALLDRPRHADIVQECRRLGTRLMLFSDGDVAVSLEAARPDSSIDLMIGVGGSQEGVISACALACMGGYMQGRLWPSNQDQRKLAEDLQLDLGVLEIEDIVKRGNEVAFAATGISDGLLNGVKYWSGGATTNSLVMRSASGTVRILETHHHWSRPGLTNIDDMNSMDELQEQQRRGMPMQPSRELGKF